MLVKLDGPPKDVRVCSEIGVRVTLVEPGFIKTEFAQAIDFSNEPSLSEYGGIRSGLDFHFCRIDSGSDLGAC